jgi:hypothetical protein
MNQTLLMMSFPFVGGWRQAVCVVFAEASRFYQRPGIVYLPIRDAPLGHWAFVWRTATESPLVRAFADAARALDGAGATSA